MVDARTFQALSDPTRLKILSLLGGGSMNVSAMVERLDCTQPAVSRHLKVLREAGLIVDARRGKWIEYSSNPLAVAEAAEYLKALYEAGREAGGEGRDGARKRQAARPAARARSTARARVAHAAAEVARTRADRGRAPGGPSDKLPAAESPDTRAPAEPPDTRAAYSGTSRYVVERDEDFIDDLML